MSAACVLGEEAPALRGRKILCAQLDIVAWTSGLSL
jgi:hypothetical protein